MVWRVALITVAACGRVGFDAVDAVDTGVDGAPPCALGPWSAPVRITSVSSGDDEFAPALSPNGEVLVYQSDAGTSSAILMAVRTGPTTFAAPTVPAALASNDEEYGPAWSADGAQLYFVSDRAGPLQVWASAFDGTEFGPPAAIPGLDGIDGPTLSRDGLELFYTTLSSPRDLGRATRASLAAPWQLHGGAGLEAINTGSTEGFPSLSADGTTLYFETTRGGETELFRAVRPAPAQPFGAPEPVDELNLAGTDSVDADISADDRTMVFSSSRAGGGLGFEIFLSTRACL